MRYIKEFRLFESGEWNRDVDWEYAKEHPDQHIEEVALINDLSRKVKEIIKYLDDESILKLNDIKGFDMYSGCYAKVSIFGRYYKIWMDEVYGVLWIEDFPIDNTSDDDRRPGFSGYSDEIAELLNDINNSGGLDTYQNVKKYNL